MNEHLDRLIDLLDRETDLYRLLLQTVCSEREALLDSDLDRLNRACKEKENTILKIQIMEEQRLANLNLLAAEAGLPASSMTLRKLVDHADEIHGQRLNSLLDTWRDLIGQIRTINQRNRGLLTHSIDLVRGSLALLNNLINTTPVYQRTGGLSGRRHTGTLFSGEV